MIKFAHIAVALFLITACSSSSEKSAIDWATEFTKQGLVEVDTVNYPIRVELRYSTNNNFVGKDVYGNLEMAYLQPETNAKLNKAASILEAEYPELEIVIWDAARPRRIQQILWDSVDVSAEERPMYVANPKTGSIHNYGGALDLTLGFKDGNLLDMGTDYDNFTKAAHIDKEDELIAMGVLSKAQARNREILRSIMVQAEFIPLTSEWWHFDAFSRDKTKQRYSIIE